MKIELLTFFYGFSVFFCIYHLQVFHKDVIESLQSQLQELNTLGQALIQNAAKGTSTKKLDHDLEEVNTRWNTLNKKVRPTLHPVSKWVYISVEDINSKYHV